MSFMTFIGGLLLFFGALNLRTYIHRHRWPVVDGILDAVDVKIEGTVPTEGVGFFVRPKFIQKIRYTYRGNPYVVELTEYEIKAESPKLRINPEKPTEAYLDNKTLFFPVFAIGIGIILILVSIKVGANGTN